ncbi:MAG: MFS transporter [Dehalococcoidia bacterium]
MQQPPRPSAAPGEPDFRIRSLVVSAFLPTLLFGIGQGAVMPMVPLFAKDLGASVALISLIVALRGAGTMVFDIPAGMLVSKFGERWTLVGGTAVLMLVAIGAAMSNAPWQFAVISFAMGGSWSVFMLARMSYVSDLAPTHVRARALSLLGGTNRIGNAIGPMIGAPLALWFGLESAFWLQAVLSGAAAALMFFVVQDGEGMVAGHGSVLQRFGSVINDHRRTFATAGVGAVMLHVLRNARQIVLPLWGDAIGLDVGTINVIFAISSWIEVAIFYPAGMVADRWGRKWVAAPSLGVLSVGMILTPLTDAAWSLTLVGILAGFGNGLGSGIVMTLGADFSPVVGRGEFLGVWRLMADLGGSAGPLLFGAIAASATLGVASVATGGLGLIGVALMTLTMPEPLHMSRRPRRDTP